MLASSKLEVISKNQVNSVHEASLDILANTGVIFHSEDALELFKKHGAKVDGEIVYINEKMVDEAIDTAPSTYRHCARNSAQDILVGHRQKKMAFSGIYGSVYVLDPEEGRRPGTLKDYSNFIKLFQATDLVTVVGGLQVEPSDADPQKKFFQMFHQILKNTDKSVWGFPGSRDDVRNMFKMVSIAMGLENDHLPKSLVGTAICPLSPLRYTRTHAETIFAYSEQNQPLYFNSCIMAGVSGPISLMGTVTLMNAEILAGIVLTQLVRPGAPAVYEPGGTVADLKGGVYTGGGPESNLMVIAGLQMALDLYRLPTRVMGGLSDAKMVDYQAGAETIQNILMPMMAGAHFLNNALGNMDGQMTTSFEKYILDVEAAERALRVVRGIDDIDQDLSLDIIKEVGHNANYLMHPSTFKNFKRRWRPRTSIWDDYLKWERLGSREVVAHARQIYKDMLAAAPESMLEPDIDSDLERFVENVVPVECE